MDSARVIFNRIEKPYLYKLDGTRPPEEISESILREFEMRYAVAAGASGLAPGEQLDATLKLYGGKLSP